MMVSMHFLIPQFEAVIRHILNTEKIITSKLNDNDIQEERLLAPYLRCQILKKYLEKILFLNCEDYYAKKLDIISGMN